MIFITHTYTHKFIHEIHESHTHTHTNRQIRHIFCKFRLVEKSTNAKKNCKYNHFMYSFHLYRNFVFKPLNDFYALVEIIIKLYGFTRMMSDSSEPERSFFRAIDLADEHALDKGGKARDNGVDQDVECEDKQLAVYATCVYVNGDGDEHN